MRRLLATCLSWACLASCTHTAAEPSALPPRQEEGRQEMTGLEDMALEYIVSVWGPPDAEEKGPKGKVLRYKDIHGRDQDPLHDKVRLKTCIIRLELNAEDLVSSWSYESCRYEEPGL